MTKEEMTDLIVTSKKSKKLTWEEIANKVGKGTTWVTSACLGMNSTTEEVAKSICDILKLDDEVCATLQEYPHKS